jgi:hypothetical protein
LPAKYWLKNILSSEDVIKSGFYDIGSAGPNSGIARNFPPLAEIMLNPPDKKREVILIDWENDSSLQKIYSEATDSLHTKNAPAQLRQIAQTVAKHMGGAISEGKINDFSFKFQIFELKTVLKSNVIPIGKITQGSFYHRALLFKAICDRVGLAPCSLVRGDYNRAWNVVDVRKQSLATKPGQSITPPSPPKDAKRNTNNAKTTARDQKNSRKQTPQGNVFEEEDDEIINDSALMDLMFEPGKLLIERGSKANAYQRM